MGMRYLKYIAGKTYELQFAPVKNSEEAKTRIVVLIREDVHPVCGIAVWWSTTRLHITSLTLWPEIKS